MKGATAIGVLRLAAAATGVAALIGRFFYGQGFITFSVGNYLGYLTHQTNIAAVLMFAAGGVTMLRGIREPGWASAARMLITSYLVVAGIVFGLLAAQAAERDYRLDVPWSDQLLHFWIPGFALADWLLSPGRHRVPWRFSYLVLLYPLIWGAVTMVRGSIVGWYPYFFLDPGQLSSIGEFATYSSLALALFAAAATTLNLGSRVILPIGANLAKTRRRPALRVSATHAVESPPPLATLTPVTPVTPVTNRSPEAAGDAGRDTSRR
ncbi:Pr6Pr family membrane protein [Lysobacter korlensis]|uniref:Pr6Pr family membrane protein n=1 Tax=Lysobacter korlensis TaxID=553636 RepID=A0ABV6RZW5_9GAMM